MLLLFILSLCCIYLPSNWHKCGLNHTYCSICISLARHSPVVRGKLFASKMFDRVLQKEDMFSSSVCQAREDRAWWLSKSCLGMMCEEWRGDTKCSPDHCLCVWLASHCYKASLVRHPAPDIVLLFFFYLKTRTQAHIIPPLQCLYTCILVDVRTKRFYTINSGKASFASLYQHSLQF